MKIEDAKNLKERYVINQQGKVGMVSRMFGTDDEKVPDDEKVQVEIIFNDGTIGWELLKYVEFVEDNPKHGIE